ncbi:MAG: peptidyl-prolyl cis-trans isomerase, partial [Flavobacteriaceae bacterium]
LNQLRRSLRRFDSIDRVNLDSLSFQFADFQLNDSLWQPQDKLREQLNFDEAKRLTRFLKKSQFFEIRDSLEVYLLFVKDLLDQGDTAPYSYVSNTLKNIILNQRKLAFLRQFDNEIIQDAIQTKKVEFYQ